MALQVPAAGSAAPSSARGGRKASSVAAPTLVPGERKVTIHPRALNRGRRGRDPGSDKEATPVPTAEDQADMDKKALLTDEILALKIKPEDLEKLREPKPPAEPKASPKSIKVAIRKIKPPVAYTPQTTVVVAVPAPPESPIKPIEPDMSGITGPRFDRCGKIIPHSILGDVENFIAEACRTENFPEEILESLRSPRPRSAPLTVKYPKKTRKKTTFPKFQSGDENNALTHWETKMADRRRQQDYLSGLLCKPTDFLVMNQADAGYRKSQELKHLIDRTMPFIDRGKGYRVGSEFWTEPVSWGGEFTGLNSTLKQTERGYPPPIEHIAVPKVGLCEKGLFAGPDDEKPMAPFQKPWHKAAYLRERVAQLAPLMDELDPHEPHMPCLQVLGTKITAECCPCPHHKSPCPISDCNNSNKSNNAVTSTSNIIFSEPSTSATKLNQMTNGKAASCGTSVTNVNMAIVGTSMTNVNMANVGSSSMNGNTSNDAMSANHANASVQVAGQTNADSCNSENTDPFRNYPDVHAAVPIIGPSIQFAGQPAHWTGDPCAFRGQIAIEARVSFETFAGERVTSFLEMINDGTTAIYYDWMKVHKPNPFEVATGRIQRFYFNQGHGVLIPGDNIKFPFVFKTPNAGVFSEQWEFQTHPVVAGGAALRVMLRGVAIKQDKFKQQRKQLEDELERRQANQIVCTFVSEIVDGIQTPERPGSPIDAYTTVEEIFKKRNPKLQYTKERFDELLNLYVEVVGPDEDDYCPEWDYTLKSVRMAILDLPDEVDAELDREALLLRLNQIVTAMSFAPFQPKEGSLMTAGYMIVCQAVDRIELHAVQLSQAVGLTPKESTTSLEDANVSASNVVSAVVQSTPSDSKLAEKKGAKAKEIKKGKDAKISPKSSKEAIKEAKEVKATSSTTAVKSSPSAASVTTVDSQASVIAVPPGEDPVLIAAKYREKLYAQMYHDLCDMADEMDALLFDLMGR